MNSDERFESSTPSKSLLKDLQSKQTSSGSSDGNLRFAHHDHSTPPSRFTKLRNPFEAHLAEKIHTNFLSPSVFKLRTPKMQESFKWTIEELSMLKPAAIEASLEQYETNDLDSVIESSVQAKIDMFFSQGVVPSPFNQECKTVPLVSEYSTPNRSIRRTCEVSTQTALTLPMDLPPELEEALKPYFNQEELVSSKQEPEFDGVLYKKLFDCEEADRSNGSIESSPPKSLNLSPIGTPSHSGKPLDFDRNLGASFNLDECNLSPISTKNSSNNFREKKSAARLDIGSQMSVDDSTNVVPNLSGQDFKMEQSFDCSYNTSLKELSGNSSLNWDMEFNMIRENTPRKKYEMDVSNSNTPKSKIFSSNRKNLSNSFLCEDEPRICYLRRTLSETTDITDAGYQTASTFTDETYSKMYVSTPSKRINST